jgi:hypothetical protein
VLKLLCAPRKFAEGNNFVVRRPVALLHVNETVAVKAPKCSCGPGRQSEILRSFCFIFRDSMAESHSHFPRSISREKINESPSKRSLRKSRWKSSLKISDAHDRLQFRHNRCRRKSRNSAYVLEKNWSGREDLNLRPPGPEPRAGQNLSASSGVA